MTTNPHIRAGSAYGCNFVSSGCNAPQSECMSLCLHRVDGSRLKDNRAVLVAGNFEEPSRSTLPTATEFAAPEPIDFASFRPIVIAGLVLCIAGLFSWWLS